jgi:hypothetical protein
MTIYLFANNAQTTLANSLTSSATTATLAPGTGSLFPNPSTGQGFKLTFVDAATQLLNEIVLVTARTGDVVTILRGQEGTTPQSWLAGDLAGMLYTAGTQNNNIQIDQFQIGTYAFGIAGGTGNALTATIPSNLAYIPTNFTFTLQASNANTGACTLNLTMGTTTTGVYPLTKANNQPLVLGDIPNAGYPMLVSWSPVYSAYVLQNPATGQGAVVTPTQLQQQYWLYGIATGGANTIATTIPSPLTAVSDGMRVNVRTLYANTTATPNLTLTLGSTSTGTIGIVKGNNQPLSVGDIPGSGYVAEFVYSSQFSKWILLNAYINQVTLPAGTVIQTQFVTSTTGYTISPSANILSLSITPQYANSKLLITMVCAAVSSGEGQNGAYLTSYRGSTALSTSIMGSSIQADDPANRSASCLTNIYMDSPATTSAVTYNMVIGSISDNDYPIDYYTVYVGSNIPNSWNETNVQYPTANYSILIQEIKQ